jgi:hypothetical protein
MALAAAAGAPVAGLIIALDGLTMLTHSETTVATVAVAVGVRQTEYGPSRLTLRDGM